MLGLEDNASLIWDAITKETFAHTGTKRVIKTQAEYNNLLLEHTNIPKDENDKQISNIKAMRIIFFALPSDTFRLVISCETPIEIWDRLRELYLSDTDHEHSI